MSADRHLDPATRVAELEQELRVQRALVAIVDAANRSDDLGTFYPVVHEALKPLTHATNCYIALYDDARQAINFPYYVDEVDRRSAGSAAVGAVRRGGRGGHHRVPAAHRGPRSSSPPTGFASSRRPARQLSWVSSAEANGWASP